LSAGFSEFAHFVKSLAVFILLGITALAAVENQYDAFAQTIAPLVQLFSAEPTKAPSAAMLSLSVAEATALPPELKSAVVELRIVRPDRVRLDAKWEGETLIVCRNGQTLWASPRDTAERLLEAVPKKKKKKKESGESPVMPPMIIPLPPQQLALLPALFQVRDGEFEDFNGVSARRLDLQLMPELGRSIGVAGWQGRLWIDAAHKPLQIEATVPAGKYSVRIDRLEYDPVFPPETWEPPKDALLLPPERWKPLADSFGRILGID
jgi:hypothetical protein